MVAELRGEMLICLEDFHEMCLLLIFIGMHDANTAIGANFWNNQGTERRWIVVSLKEHGMVEILQLML